MKASQVFFTLRDFLTVAQDMKVREKEIPDTLRRRAKLVEDVCWWLEGGSEDVLPTYIHPEESVLNVRIQDLYLTVVRWKLIEKEKEEEEKLRIAKAAKKHVRRKKDVKEEKIEEPKKIRLSENEQKLADVLQQQISYLESFRERKAKRIEELNERVSEISSQVETDGEEEVIAVLKNFFAELVNERKSELDAFNQELETLALLEATELEKSNDMKIPTEHDVPKKQFVKAVPMQPSENIFMDFELKSEESIPDISEAEQCIDTCRKLLLKTLGVRQKELNEINYLICNLHFKERLSQLGKTEATAIPRKVLVSGAKMKIREINKISVTLEKFGKIYEIMVFFLPNTLQSCKILHGSLLEKFQEKSSIVNKLLSKIEGDIETDVSQVEMLKDICEQLIHVYDTEIQHITNTVSKIRTKKAHPIEVFSNCNKIYEEALESRKKEFDALLNCLDLLDGITVELNSADSLIVKNCRDIFLTSIIIRIKEMQSIQEEIKKCTLSVKEPLKEIFVTLKDIFYAGLQMEREHYEKIILPDCSKEEESQNECLPVVYTLKQLYEIVALEIKMRHVAESDDPLSYKSPQVYTTLEEFLSTAFELKQREIEIPLSVLKQGFQAVLSSLVKDVRARERERIGEVSRRYQALKILISWKEVFLLAAKHRRTELTDVLPVRIKELKEEEAAIRAMKHDERLNVDWEVCFFSILSLAISSNILAKKNKIQQTIL